MACRSLVYLCIELYSGVARLSGVGGCLWVVLGMRFASALGFSRRVSSFPIYSSVELLSCSYAQLMLLVFGPRVVCGSSLTVSWVSAVRCFVCRLLVMLVCRVFCFMLLRRVNVPRVTRLKFLVPRVSCVNHSQFFVF